MSVLCFTQDYYVVYICPDVIFWILPPYSRPMMSYHVTAMSHASSSSIKEKRKENSKEKKYKIKKNR